MKRKMIATLFSMLILLLSTSCTMDNLLVKPETTPGGRKTVDNIVASIEAVEPAVISITPYEYVSGLLSNAFDAIGAGLSEKELEEMMDGLFPGLETSGVEFSYSYVAPAKWSVISDILSLTTKEDIAYLNSRLSVLADKDAAYGSALDDFYNLVRYLAGEDVKVSSGLFSVTGDQELDMSDFISIQIAFRLIFKNCFDAVAASYDAYSEACPEGGIAGYIGSFDIRSVLRQFLSKDIMNQILNYYTVLYRISPSTSIVKVSALSDLLKEGI